MENEQSTGEKLIEFDGNAMTYEMADLEIRNYLKARRVKSRKIESDADTFESLVEAMMDGDITVEGDVLKLKLSTPLGEGAKAIKELTFKPRVNLKAVKTHLSKYKAGDVEGRFLSYTTAATNVPTAALEHLDTTDWTLVIQIVGFYM